MHAQVEVEQLHTEKRRLTSAYLCEAREFQGHICLQFAINVDIDVAGTAGKPPASHMDNPNRMLKQLTHLEPN